MIRILHFVHPHRRTGRGGTGGSCPPKKITKSKSRANVQQKSGEEWEIKKPKSQKAPSLLGKQRQSGNIRFTVGQYWLITKRTGTNYVNFVVNLVMYGKHRGGGRSPKLICSTKNFSGLVGQNPKKSGKFFSAPLIFSFPYAHVHPCVY